MLFRLSQIRSADSDGQFDWKEMSSSQFGQGDVIVIPDDSKFQPELQRAGDRLVVVDFTASWYVWF